ncbi:hypothetical protein BGX31_004829 [Mortierella sp. GBA43]|nr:hypothetical protein BGX31_004829 [Mortierella sp. GBA43]
MTLTTPMRMTLTTFIKPLRAVARPAGFRFYSIGSATVPAAFQVFNRETKRHQKERAASNIEQSRQVDYVKDEVAFRVVDRLLDIKREFNEVVELGSGCGHIAKHVDTDMMKKLIMCDMSETMLNRDKDIEYEGKSRPYPLSSLRRIHP